jgi:rhamnogalacturonyl hydrolase YesR
MQRRNFLASIPLAGLTLSSSGVIASTGSVLDTSAYPFSKRSTIEKVTLAMLSMQRATWEQGVAMQALLELGETELVILMAKDAVLRQSQDGRLAMLGEEFALSDACSPGEAVLWAAKKTGDPFLMRGYEKLLDYVLNKAPRNKDGIIYHFTNIPQIWSDINYMLPPFLAISGEYSEAIKQIDVHGHTCGIAIKNFYLICGTVISNLLCEKNVGV